MNIPNPVREANLSAEKVIALERTINEHYRKHKRISYQDALTSAMTAFEKDYKRVLVFHPEWAATIPNVSKPIYKR